MERAIDTQVGGDHYSKCAMQPYEYIVKGKLTFTQGNIAKYITRHKNKNGRQDIEKCMHYAQLGKEFDDVNTSVDLVLTTAYCKVNELDKYQSNILTANAMGDYDRVIKLCKKTIHEQYDLQLKKR